MFRVSKPPLRRLRQGLPDRGRTLDDLIPLLRRAWTGEPFEHRGTTVRVTPTPVQDPMPIYVGGASRRGVERAVRLADGYFPPGLPAGWRRYRALTIDAGRPDPGEFPPSGPIFLWVTTEPKEQVWEHLAPPFGTRSTRTRPGPSRPTADQTGPSCPPGTSRAFVRGAPTRS